MSQFYGNLELINTSVNPTFNNTSNNDLVLYTDSSNQRIHLGCGSNATGPASLTLSSSNLLFNGDLTISNRFLTNFTRVRVSPPVVTGTPANISTVVNAVPGINSSSASSFDFQLSNQQASYRFLDSNNNTLLSISSNAGLVPFVKPILAYRMAGTTAPLHLTDTPIRYDVLETFSQGTSGLLYDAISGAFSNVSGQNRVYQISFTTSFTMSNVANNNAGQRVHWLQVLPVNGMQRFGTVEAQAVASTAEATILSSSCLISLSNNSAFSIYCWHNSGNTGVLTFAGGTVSGYATRVQIVPL